MIKKIWWSNIGILPLGMNKKYVLHVGQGILCQNEAGASVNL